MSQPRRFPPPWSIEEHNNACFIVKDADSQTLAYVYFEDEPGREIVVKRVGSAASIIATTSATLHTWSVTPAAIAGGDARGIHGDDLSG